MDTRQKIIEESMKLFSVYGFDSVSIRKIAEAVGVTNSALYKHFKSKRDILDAIVEKSKNLFMTVCAQNTIDIKSIGDVKDMCLKMFKFQTENEWIVMFRRLLMLEQYKNKEMADIFRQFFIESPVKFEKEIFDKYIQKGVMKDLDSEVMAVEFYAPFFLYHTSLKNVNEMKNMFEKHIDNFFSVYLI